MRIFFAMPGNEELASSIARLVHGELGELETRRFPDGESYVRLHSDVTGRDAFIVCTLARPDPQFLALAFAALEIRARGARRICLIAPYLAYMRQDRVFHPGEALTSAMFAKLLQQQFDELITIDPHLHRHRSLSEVYDIPSTALHAGCLLGDWIAAHVPNPLILGPDEESAQWVESIAARSSAPWLVFTKERRGDREVRMRTPDMRPFEGRTAVIVDDVISSGATMQRALRMVRQAGFAAPYCLVVHSLCSRATARKLRDSSVAFLASNSVLRRDAAFDVAPLVASALAVTSRNERATSLG